MSDLLIRAFPGDLALRSDGRTVVGLACPWGEVARVRDGSGPAYDETFRRGAFARTITERGDRVKVYANHSHRQGASPIGKAVRLTETDAGLEAELRISATAAGDEALQLVRDGALDSLSVGFSPLRTVREGGRTVRTEVALGEISLVPYGAYDGARVMAVRSADFPWLTDAERRLDLLRLSLEIQ